RVQIVDREATPEDAKSGLFYPHFRGLTGTIQKIYANQEAAVELETESLPDPIAHRHDDVQEQMKTRWLDGLSEEARHRLSEQELDFRLRYTVLVALGDLITPGKKAATPAARPASEPSLPKPTAAAQSRSTAEPPPPRATSADLDAAEAAEIERRRRG
ncbi:MAG TPA: hypothetical protein VKT32_11830, partial [Chthonomonadaceae bacterium]|nr:hypothetical protein [Chthonomonadaceae bacterium]